ncbi:MAG: hypothetical protein R3F37_19430 [Candidatus Competibacteraceae bacterium]
MNESANIDEHRKLCNGYMRIWAWRYPRAAGGARSGGKVEWINAGPDAIAYAGTHGVAQVQAFG